MIPMHAALSYREVIELLEEETARAAEEFELLTEEVRRIARNKGPADDYEAATLRQLISESEKVN